MSKKNKILLLGPVSPPVSGPGVKNKNFLLWLNNQTEVETLVFNTYDIRDKNIRKILSGLNNFIKADKIVLSVSENGRFILIPLCISLGKKTILFPAGGSFDAEINSLSTIQKKLFIYFCKKIEASFVQTQSLKSGLDKLKFKNVFFLPNPRIDQKYRAQITPNSNRFKIIFLSKIRHGKGPLLLIDAVRLAREHFSDTDITLDFYGMIDSSFVDEFNDKLNKNSFCRYQGVCEPSNVQETISKYDLFVLPTFFPEGVPGAVIDAMYTGIPIIISNYTAATDMINNNNNGIIVPQKSLEALRDAIIKIVSNYSFRKKLSHNSLINAKSYDYEKLMSQVKNQIIN